MQHSAAMATRLKHFPNPGGLSLETLDVWKAVVDIKGGLSHSITRGALSKLTPWSVEKCLPRIVNAGLLEYGGRRYSLTPKGSKWSALAREFRRHELSMQKDGAVVRAKSKRKGTSGRKR
jgi:hypothetical protein